MLYGIILAIGRSVAASQTIPAPYVKTFKPSNLPTFKPPVVYRPSSIVLFFSSPTALLVLFMSFYSLLHILTWAMTRYRLPVDAVAINFAALAIHHLMTRVTSGGRALQARDAKRAA